MRKSEAEAYIGSVNIQLTMVKNSIRSLNEEATKEKTVNKETLKELTENLESLLRAARRLENHIKETPAMDASERTNAEKVSSIARDFAVVMISEVDTLTSLEGSEALDKVGKIFRDSQYIND